MMRFISVERRDWVVFRNYWHSKRGHIQTASLTEEPNVIHVAGPNFGAGERSRHKPRVRGRKKIAVVGR